MTAELFEDGAPGGRITAPRTTRIDAFLLAGRDPGASATDAVRRAVSYGVAAEAGGFDGCWFAEHHFVGYGCCPSAPALAAHLLGRTERITVGTAACVLSSRHPVALAEEAVLLAAVSAGRFALGVARGGPWVDLEVFGTGLSRYRTGFAEALDVLTGWLSGVDTYGTSGEHFSFRPVSVVPQPDHPIPVYVAATSPSTVDRAAERGLPLLLGMHATDTEKRA
ncbi:MAG TPA: LLM class flavin-dependent oxidoreductase [Actinocatenispora sp.]